jgi:predicted RNase H-like HicB family nuclease
MSQPLRFRMEYWKDGNWYVGRLPQVPGVFSQGATLDELERNIRDAYRLMLEEQSSPEVRQRYLVDPLFDALAYY